MTDSHLCMSLKTLKVFKHALVSDGHLVSMSSLRWCCMKPKALWLATEPSSEKKKKKIENLNIL